MSKYLILCYDFPPNNNIGGRRWFKFASQLAKNGHEVRVVTVSDKSGYKLGLIKVSTVKQHFLIKMLQTQSSSIIDKLKYRFAKTLIQFLHKGSIYDSAALIKSQIKTKAVEIIKNQKTDVLIATGAPFTLCVVAAEIKLQNQNLKLLLDYRDPWATAVNLGMTELNTARRDYEANRQRFTFDVADRIFAPSNYITERDANFIKYKTDERFVELNHTLINENPVLLNTNNNGIIKIVYGGSIYLGAEILIKQIHSISSKLDGIEFQFYCPEWKKYQHLNTNVVRFVEPNHTGYSDVLSSADYFLLLIPDHKKDYLTTKFIESLPYRKPFIVFGEKGYCSEFTVQNRLGTFYSHSQLEKLGADIKSNQTLQNFNKGFDLSQYSIETITNKIESL